MNIVKRLTIVLVCFASFGCASFPSGRPYVGQVESVGLKPIETLFYRNAEGGITGLYAFQDGASKTTGLLDACELTENRVLKCRWADKYGSGNFAVKFSENYKAFEGGWGDLDSDALNGSTWNGKKKKRICNPR